eukprot:7114266-Heterocapsa_arctica.AAC.1
MQLPRIRKVDRKEKGKRGAERQRGTLSSERAGVDERGSYAERNPPVPGKREIIARSGRQNKQG